MNNHYMITWENMKIVSITIFSKEKKTKEQVRERIQELSSTGYDYELIEDETTIKILDYHYRNYTPRDYEELTNALAEIQDIVDRCTF